MKHGQALCDPSHFLVAPETAREMGTRASQMGRSDGPSAVRCPACRGELVARMFRDGPAYRCLCPS